MLAHASLTHIQVKLMAAAHKTPAAGLKFTFVADRFKAASAWRGSPRKGAPTGMILPKSHPETKWSECPQASWLLN